MQGIKEELRYRRYDMNRKTEQRICRIIDEAIADGTTAGASILVRKENEELFFDARGYADVEKKLPMCRDTIFRMYSMTKPVTAAAAMILLERGELDPAQEVGEILPGFSELMVEQEDGEVTASETPMTVLHLLNMTSGLTYGDEDTKRGRETAAYIEQCCGKMYGKDAVTTLEFASHLGSIPLAFEPDSSWCYGLSADVLGAVVETVSGMRYGDFLRENLFEPLGMEDTDFWVPQEKQVRLANAYETVGKGRMIPYTGDNLIISNQMKTRPAFESGGAGLVSTIDDYARFAQMLLNGGSLNGRRVLSEATVHFLTDGALTDAQQAAMRHWVGLEGFTYSHLMWRMVNPGQSVGLGREGEYGWNGWLGCYFANFPREKMTILLMQQKKDAGTITMTRKIRNVILAEL